MDSLLQKRTAAVKTADAVSAVEGTPISDYAIVLSASWARGDLTGEEMKDALLTYHRNLAEQERRSHV